jgi:predicted transposase YbfD/YdcC
MLSKYIVLPRSLSYSAVFSVKPEPVTTLWYMLHEIVDCRRAQGRRHDLPTLLTLAILSLCSGHLSYLAMKEWCVNYQDIVLHNVPFLAGHMPNEATFHRVFATLDEKALEDVLGAWIQTVIPLQKGEGIAIDGKTIHKTGVHIVAAFAHIAKAILFEIGTDEKGKELVIGPELIKKIAVKDRIVTGDALFTQRTFCELITSRAGGYLFRVKGNQDTLEKEIRLFFEDPPFKAALQTHKTVDAWKGQVEKREVSVSSDPQLLDYLKWPGLTHIWQMKKTVTKKGVVTTEVSVGIACIPEELCGKFPIAEKITDTIRTHWSIEIRAHRTRDVIFNEDHATIRKGHAPQVMAALRNLVTSIFHRGTVRSFPTAMRRFAAKPEELFDFLGLQAVQNAQMYA